MTIETKDIQANEAEKQEATIADGTERTRAGRAYIPRADIYETDTHMVVLADMPGVDERSVEITLEKNVLNIRGFVEPVNPDNYSLAYAEYEVGDYERSFTLSNQFDFAKIDAEMKNGVLRLTLPKVGPAQTKRIEVKAA